MKEASGELSMTAVAVVIIGIVAVVAPVIIRSVGNSMKMKSNCRAAYACTTADNEMYSCKYQDENGTEQTISCSSADISFTN